MQHAFGGTLRPQTRGYNYNYKVQLLRCNFLQSGACFQEKIGVKFSEKHSIQVHLHVEDSKHFDQEKENMMCAKCQQIIVIEGTSTC